MQITPVDQDNNLFAVSDVVPQSLVDKVVSTSWLTLPWQRQEGQESWSRRRIEDSALPWLDEWNQYIGNCIPLIERTTGQELIYGGTAWWLDEPGFICTLHTDGELPGSLHIAWVGDENLATTFYNTKNSKDVRFTQPFKPNFGYIMINQADKDQYRLLQWHGMLYPVPSNTYRLTSYSLLIPR